MNPTPQGRNQRPYGTQMNAENTDLGEFIKYESGQMNTDKHNPA
jgi:hypothetical protein